MDSITLPTPCDFHVHFRDDWRTRVVVPYTARDFGLAVVEPNLSPPITAVGMAHQYRERLMREIGHGKCTGLIPRDREIRLLMTIYLTDDTPVSIVDQMASLDWVLGFKLYPSFEDGEGITTGSSHGVRDIPRRYKIFERCQELGVPVTLHGQSADPSVDIYDASMHFLERTLAPMRRVFPGLIISIEHLDIEPYVDFVYEFDHTFGTITPQHLVLNRNDMLRGGLRPHRYCMPLPHREDHRQALVRAAVNNRPDGKPKFFAGTDTAPHAKGKKETACGCAGCFNAPTALATYLEVFREAGGPRWLDAAVNFLCHNGPDAYGFEQNRGTIQLVREPTPVPKVIEGIVPLFAGQNAPWRVVYE